MEFYDQDAEKHKDDIHTKLDRILYLLKLLVKGEVLIMADLSVLQNEVTQNTDVVQSAVALISGLADQLEAAATDPAAVQALAESLRTNNQMLAEAVAANTPVAPPTQEPTG